MANEIWGYIIVGYPLGYIISDKMLFNTDEFKKGTPILMKIILRLIIGVFVLAVIHFLRPDDDYSSSDIFGR